MLGLPSLSSLCFPSPSPSCQHLHSFLPPNSNHPRTHHAQKKKTWAHLVELNARLEDLISDLGSGGKGRNVLADGGEGERHLVGLGPRDLSLGSLSENDDRGVRVGLDGSLGGLGNGRVDTTAKTRVRGDGNNEGLASGIGSLGVGEEL